MATIDFVDPYLAGDDGLVAKGGQFTPENLLKAYGMGVFPWPTDEDSIYWVSPIERGVMFLDELHIPRSLRKDRERTNFTFTIDHDFPSVIAACAAATRHGQQGTWIIDSMIAAYCNLHQLGYAHSVEVWDGDELVGGLYGVEVHGIYAGESMFHRRTNASKFALLHMIDHLRERGAQWIDIQMVTPHMAILGGKAIPRHEFLELLAATQSPDRKLFG
ncbi:MAG: leucyl/phenylalanyl-tRNA--protein transferase [Armatimonadetes bacterium]|nr:leucyl/phenylalanyl-tRNA--protein transferase [Armatimonadota bacterium]